MALMKNPLRLLGLMVFCCCGVFAVSNAPAAEPYHFLKEIPIGGDGGWDYLSVDAAGRRLYVSHGTKVVVVDLDKEQVVGEIEDTPGIHGFVVAAELGRGFSSNGREAKASIIDLKTLKTISKVDTGENPDAILYETVHHEVYTFNGRANTFTAFEAGSGKVLATVPLPGKPEFAVEDPKAERIYNNIEDKDEVVVIDAKEHKVVNTWPIAPGKSASGMAIDLEHHRLFLGCGDNNLMVMMDSASGKVLDKVTIGQGVDANAYDPQTQYAFASCGDGTVTIAHEDSPDKLTLVQTLKTQRGSRTMTLDPQTHKIYLGAVQYEGQADQKAGAPRQRPKMVAGSFKILVYGMDSAKRP
jgi:DNA-binding beta-propeller fold protein YncE